MTYEEAIAYLYSQLPVFSRIGPAAYKKDIHNTVALCEALGNPQQNFKSIHIAGTNGKGSTSHTLAAILQQQGYRTGLYTSPHIHQFGERIRINGRMIDEEFVVDFTERTKILCDSIKPSFFELTVAMAFDYFSKEKVDIAIIETGLGGRLDSTNIINPLLSVITNIGMDHMNLLGDTIEQIAFEKAGIIKSQTPVVIGETLPETKKIFEEKATQMQAPIIFSEDFFDVTENSNNGLLMECSISNLINGYKENITTDLSGDYQLKNLRTVLTAVHTLNQNDFSISHTSTQQALANVKKLTGIKGRWDVQSTNPLIVHDVAHNKDGITAILQHLDKFHHGCNWHFVMGFVNDKDISGILELLPTNSKYYFTNAHIQRALSHEELRKTAHKAGLSGDSFDDVNEAIQEAKKCAATNDVIVVCGSFFILSEVTQ